MDNYKNLENLFDHARSQTSSHSTLNQTKGQFKNTVGTKAPIKLPNEKLGSIKLIKTLIMISVLGGVAVCLFLFVQESKETKIENKTNVVSSLSDDENTHSVLESITDSAVPKPLDKYEDIGRLPLNILQKDEMFSVENGLSVRFERLNSIKEKTVVDVAVPRNLFEGEYRFPVLTPNEIKANNRMKKRLMKIASRKGGYVYIPSGTFENEGNKVSVIAFHMQIAEVSNLQYRTFLFDLLIRGKKDAFLKAKPDQKNWTTKVSGKMKAMEEMYFSHSAFDDYPVVNVSAKGAEMYCVWLSTSLAEVYPKERFNDFRIPTKPEWMFAATTEGRNPVYPWGTESLINEHGCFLANFNYRIKDSTFWKEKRMKLENSKPEDYKVYKSDGAVHTAKVVTYNPNSFGLYNMSGNVAELVYLGPEKHIGTCGGGWMNSASEIKLNAPDPHEGKVESHPNIGFRVVSTYLKKK